MGDYNVPQFLSCRWCMQIACSCISINHNIDLWGKINENYLITNLNSKPMATWNYLLILYWAKVNKTSLSEPNLKLKTIAMWDVKCPIGLILNESNIFFILISIPLVYCVASPILMIYILKCFQLDIYNNSLWPGHDNCYNL